MADYNINAITRRVVFTGSAGLGPYAFSFEILDQDDLAVYFNATSLTITTDYTVTINANGTGSVNIVTGGSVPSTPTASDQIVIVGARDIERVTDFVTAGDLLASSLNEQLDALTIFDQQVAEENKRGLRAPVYDPALVEDGGVVDMTLPAKADRAGRFLAFDGNGNPTATTNVGDFKGDWAASTVYRIGDLVRDTTDDSIYRVNTDHTSSGSLPLNTNTNAAYYDLFVDLSDINASEAAAAASATEAEEWASKTNGIVDGTDYSSKAYALGGTGVTNTSGKGAAKEWATTTGGTVDTSEYSSKEYAIGTTVAAGSSKDWATITGATVDGSEYSSKEYATGTTVASGSAKDWASQASGTVDGSEYSAKYYSGQASTSASNAATSETNASNSASAAASAQTAAEAARDAALAAYDDFDDRYLGDFASNPTTDNDGDPLAAGMLYFNTTDDTMKVYTGSGWVAAYVSGTGFLATTGGTMTGDINFGDNDKAIFGAGSDLQIYHSGSHSVIKDAGDGNLQLIANDFQLRNGADNANMMTGANGGAITLMHNGSSKLATTATGVDVTGGLNTTGNVGIGTSSPGNLVQIEGSSGTVPSQLRLGVTASGQYYDIGRDYTDGFMTFYSGQASPYTGYKWSINAGTEAMRIDSSGNLLVGTTTASGNKFKVERTDNDNAIAEFKTNNVNGDVIIRSSGGYGRVRATGTNELAFINAGTEAMRIDSSGNVLVGTTSTPSTLISATSGGGIALDPNSFSAWNREATASNHSHLVFNQTGVDAQYLQFRKDGSEVGSIGTSSGLFYLAGASKGFRFGSGSIVPSSSTGADSDNSIDLGYSSSRFKDIYATNGTIQTSDQNEKQQIATLTDAEITAAKAISQLFKTYKWNSAVTEKGDAARTHTGVIAQDVQAAMTAAGLDAGDYAFFISSTWWEKQTEVPAVEAVEAVYEDVVIPAVLDEGGNEVEAERTEQRTVTEAVEAVAAYTRTDTYDTAEEAPEGAVERTRMGIRYHELLAFVGAATEQRLANIETRLTALEAN